MIENLGATLVSNLLILEIHIYIFKKCSWDKDSFARFVKKHAWHLFQNIKCVNVPLNIESY